MILVLLKIDHFPTCLTVHGNIKWYFTTPSLRPPQPPAQNVGVATSYTSGLTSIANRNDLMQFCFEEPRIYIYMSVYV